VQFYFGHFLDKVLDGHIKVSVLSPLDLSTTILRL
jgi:hypothetical protein